MRKQARLTTKKINLSVVLLAALLLLPLVITQLAPNSFTAHLASAANNLKQIKVGSKDTLWSLARDNRPNTNLTIKQAMLAIKDANPHAFPSNNINEMEPNSTLVIPSATEMRQRTAYQAEVEVRRQNQAWVASRNQAEKAPVTQPKVPAKPVKTITKQPAKPVTQSKPDIQLTKQLAALEAEKNNLEEQFAAANLEITNLKQLVNLKERQLDEAEEQLATSLKPAPLAAASEKKIIIEDTSLTTKMNREPWLYSGYAAAIFLSLTFFLLWLLARSRANYLEAELAKNKTQANTADFVSASTNLQTLENLEEFAELSIEDEEALDEALANELTAEAAYFTQNSEDLGKFEELDAFDELDNLNNELANLENEELEELEDLSDLESFDDLEDIEDIEDLQEALVSEPALVSATETSINEENQKLGLDELVETDLGSLDDLDEIGDLDELDLDSFDVDLANIEELEAPLENQELGSADLLKEDFEEVKYESDADEFLDALDSLEDGLGLDDLELENLEIEDSSSLVDLDELEQLIEQDDEANEVDTLATNLTSQLDLAAAYIEMGDQAGAKEILNKLVESDEVEIQIKAQQLLETLA